MSTLNLALTVAGAVLLLLGLLSGLIKNRWFVSEPLLAMLVGVAVGPVGLAWFDVAEWGDPRIVLEETARLTLAIALVETALRLPSDYLRRRWRVLVVLLGLVLPLMWGISSGLALLLLPGTAAAMFAVGAIVAPTDPVIAGSIVTGWVADRAIPERLRAAISAESGANDALALPLVMLPTLLLTRPAGEAIGHWAWKSLALEVGGGVAAGAAAGWLGGRLLRFARSRHDSERTSLLTVSLALGVTLLGGVRLAGGDGLLAAFVGGLFLNREIGGEVEAQKERLHEAIRRFFELPVFLLLGIALPFAAWREAGLALPAFVVALLLFRRLPALLVLRRLVHVTERTREALLLGWFGPIGIAALYYSALVWGKTDDPFYWHVASLVVAGSVLVHGVTATAFTRAFARRAGVDLAAEAAVTDG